MNYTRVGNVSAGPLRSQTAGDTIEVTEHLWDNWNNKLEERKNIKCLCDFCDIN